MKIDEKAHRVSTGHIFPAIRHLGKWPIEYGKLQQTYAFASLTLISLHARRVQTRVRRFLYKNHANRVGEKNYWNKITNVQQNPTSALCYCDARNVAHVNVLTGTTMLLYLNYAHYMNTWRESCEIYLGHTNCVWKCSKWSRVLSDISHLVEVVFFSPTLLAWF